MSDILRAMNQTELKRLFHYDPETGLFTRLVSRRGWMAKAGMVAGTTSKHNGYVYIQFEGSPRLAHRLAFLYMVGELPPNHVDHINGDRADNRWCNLRPATQKINSKNMRKRDSNTTGVAGVGRMANGKWRARIMVDGKDIHLYQGDNPYLAVYRRALAEHKHNFHPNHGR